MEKIHKEKDLPLDDLAKLGLVSNGKVTIGKEDLSAMLSGRRTEMISLNNLNADGIKIEQLDVRLSLRREPDGTLSLKVHPVYKEARHHSMLVNAEAEQLMSGKVANIKKTITDDKGNEHSVVIEYDEKTKEFVSYNPDEVEAPEAVYGIPLNEKQKKKFREGEEVSLHDGTIFQHRASNSKGIVSNKTALVLSILVDGGISYLLVSGLSNLFGSKRKQETAYNEGYQNALRDVKLQERGQNISR